MHESCKFPICYTTVVSRCYDVSQFEMLLIMVPNQYPNYYKALEIYTGYFESLDNMILFLIPAVS